ncbi:ComEC/Rec2 family competence protein [Thermaurantiacus sp.]
MATLESGLLQKSAPPPSRAGRLLAALGEEVRRQSPQAFLFVPVALGFGIWLWFGLPFLSQRQAALLALLALALMASSLPRGGRKVIVAGSLLAAAGMLAADVRSLSVAAPVLYHRLTPAPIEGVVERVERATAGARLRIVRDDGLRLSVRLSSPLSQDVLPGARIRLVAAFEPQRAPLFPGGHDPARSDWFEGLSARGRALGPPVVLAPAPARAPPAELLARLRQGIDRQLVGALGPRHGALAAALVTGSKAAIPEDVVEAVRVSGLAHLLTVSGFHIGALAAGVFLLARRLPLLLAPGGFAARSMRAPAAMAAIAAAWAYVLVSGAGVPAVRAGVTVSLVLLALAAGRDPLSLRLLAFAATLILLFRPEALLSPSFQLSFAAVTALILLANHPAVRSRFQADGEPLGRRALKWVGAVILSSLVAELVLAPIAAAHFGRMGLYGVLANTLAIPLTSFVLMPLLVVQLALGAVAPEGVAVPGLALALHLFERIAAWVASLPGASLAIPAAPPLARLMAVAGGLALALLAGRLRWIGLPLLAASLALHLLIPRPDLLISPDARQVGVVGPGRTLYLARGRGESFAARVWAEATAAAAVVPLADHPGARCGPDSCLVRLATSPAFMVLVLKTEDPVPPESLRAACRVADLAVGPVLDPRLCKPRWLRIDRRVTARLGSIAIHTGSGRITASAAASGDHPWSPAALPGQQKSLLGRVRWVEPMIE